MSDKALPYRDGTALYARGDNTSTSRFCDAGVVNEAESHALYLFRAW